MPIQFILSFMLVGLIAIAALRRRSGPLVALTLIVTCVLGLILVWFPSLATSAATAVGIGRGADLVFYCFIIVSLVISFWLYVSIRATQVQIAILARELAILNGVRPEAGKAPTNKIDDQT